MEERGTERLLGRIWRRTLGIKHSAGSLAERNIDECQAGDRGDG